MKKAALLVLVAVLACLSCALGEAEYVVPTKGYEPVETLDICYQPENAPAISVQMQDGKACLFLPSGADVQTLIVGGQAETCRLTEGENQITDANGNPLTLTVMQSANLRSLYLTSDDPDNAGRGYIDASPDHSTRAGAELTIVSALGDTEYDGHISTLRGRGNTTWEWGAKKPYQLKLDRQADLLGNGSPNKTFLLLAECFDATLLHNSLCLDIAEKLGLPSPGHEPVDLYYDGVYRGTYLLCEKVEVRSGLLNLPDYDKQIEKEYGVVGEPMTARAENRYGCEYQYINGLDVYSGKSAAYLLEIDEYFYQTENAWVSTKSGMHFTVQNPGLLSKTDGAYIGELLQRIENALQNGGVDPETGDKASDLLDYESLAKFFLLSEWSRNPDYWRGSTFFYKPSGEEKLYTGPVWDFDIAFGIREQESGVAGYLRDRDGWLKYLCAMPDFQETVRAVWQTELQPMLASLDLSVYIDRVAGSAAMNFALWPYGGGYNNINRDTVYDTWAGNLDFLRSYLSGRLEWMDQDIAGWMGHDIESAALTLYYRNADVPNSYNLNVVNRRNNVTLSGVTLQSAPDPELAWNDLYTVTGRLTAAEDCALADGFGVTVNGDPVTVTRVDGSTADIRFTFSGPKYEPALYDGEDYGMLYQYDYFVAHNPNAAEECDTGDPEETLEFYVTCGLYDELQGIETYVSQAFINNYYRKMDEYFMCDPESCAEYYRENCVTENLLGMAEQAYPKVLP